MKKKSCLKPCFRQNTQSTRLRSNVYIFFLRKKNEVEKKLKSKDFPSSKSFGADKVPKSKSLRADKVLRSNSFRPDKVPS